MIETILIMIATSAIFSFGIMIGYKLGNKEEPIIVPEIKEVKEKIPFTKENKMSKDQKEEINKLNTLLKNIDSYDGTGNHQRRLD